MRGAAVRGLRNPFRSRTRAVVVVLLLALVTGFLGLMVQATVASRQHIARLDARVRTLVELREAGAFGTGGFGGDKPVGEHDFTVDTLERVRRIPHAAHLAGVDEYVYTPQVDPARPNAYAMVIGHRLRLQVRHLRGQPRPRHQGQRWPGDDQDPQRDADQEGQRSPVPAGTEEAARSRSRT